MEEESAPITDTNNSSDMIPSSHDNFQQIKIFFDKKVGTYMPRTMFKNVFSVRDFTKSTKSTEPYVSKSDSDLTNNLIFCINLKILGVSKYK